MSRGTVAGAGAHSPATAGTLGIARSSPLHSLHVHSGQQTYDQSPAIPSPLGLENPGIKSLTCL